MWNIIYKLYPSILRILEKLKIHNSRQPYFITTIENIDIQKFERYLKKVGFEKAILSWKDPGEVLSMRKIDNDKYQYHIRIFSNGEIRGHYEYSSESNPIKHVIEAVFLPEKSYFERLIVNFVENK